jgi:alpha-L-fucosidase
VENVPKKITKRKFIPSPVVWRATTKPGKVFIHVFQWPQDGKLVLPALKQKITKAYLLAEPSAQISVDQQAGKIILTLPSKAPDPIVSVVCLEVTGSK